MQPLEWFCSRNPTIWHLLSCYCIFPAYSSQIPPALLVQIRICLSLAYKRNEKTLKLSLPRTFQTGLVTTTVLTYLFMKHWKRRMTSLWKRGEGQGTPPGSILSPCSHPGHFTPGSPYPIPPTPCPMSSVGGTYNPGVYRKECKTQFSQTTYLILFSAARSHSSLASEVSSSSLEITISIS